jgi:hypothetical protein
MVCVAIYAVLLQAIPTSSNIHLGVWTAAGYTVLLCASLFKSSSLSKRIFGSS